MRCFDLIEFNFFSLNRTWKCIIAAAEDIIGRFYIMRMNFRWIVWLTAMELNRNCFISIYYSHYYFGLNANTILEVFYSAFAYRNVSKHKREARLRKLFLLTVQHHFWKKLIIIKKKWKLAIAEHTTNLWELWKIKTPPHTCIFKWSIIECVYVSEEEKE